MTRRHRSHWRLARRATALAFLALLLLGATGRLGLVVGTTSATEIAGAVPLVDPLAFLESLLAARRTTTAAAIGAGTLLAAAALLGPVFCGWACPLGLLLDLQRDVGERLRSLRRGRHVPQRPVPRRIPAPLRWIVLGLCLGFAFAGPWPIFQAVSPINLLVRAVVLGASGGLLAIGAIMLLELVAPRTWCRALCPLGALHALVGRFAPIRVRIHAGLAGRTPCERCSRACPVGIDVMNAYALRGATAVTHPDCMRCGDCIDACPSGVLRLGLRPPDFPIETPAACPHRGEPVEVTVGATR